MAGDRGLLRCFATRQNLLRGIRRLSAVQATQDGVMCGIGVVFRMDTHGPHSHPGPSTSSLARPPSARCPILDFLWVLQNPIIGRHWNLFCRMALRPLGAHHATWC